MESLVQPIKKQDLESRKHLLFFFLSLLLQHCLFLQLCFFFKLSRGGGVPQKIISLPL